MDVDDWMRGESLEVCCCFARALTHTHVESIPTFSFSEIGFERWGLQDLCEVSLSLSLCISFSLP